MIPAHVYDQCQHYDVRSRVFRASTTDLIESRIHDILSLMAATDIIIRIYKHNTYVITVNHVTNGPPDNCKISFVYLHNESNSCTEHANCVGRYHFKCFCFLSYTLIYTP